jgi:hypothetical protein
MPKRRFLALAAILVALSASARADDGLIEGKGWAFLASAPPGWVRDERSLGAHGIKGLYVKAGAKFSPGKLHMYITPFAKTAGAPASLEEFMAVDEKTFMSSDSAVVARRIPDYAPGMGYTFPRKELDDAPGGYFQDLAYYEGEGAFFVFVLACRSAQEREREGKAFLELLDSFVYVAKDR